MTEDETQQPGTQQPETPHAGDAVPPGSESPPSRGEAGRRAFVFAAVLAVLAAAILLGVLAYGRVSAQARARDDVAKARGLIGHVDIAIRQADVLIRAQAEPDIADEVDDLIGRLPEAKREASEAAALLDGAAPHLAAKERPEAVDAADAARLRGQLLDAAMPLLVATGKASKAIGPAEEGWTLLLGAEDKSDKAAKLYNSHDKAKVRQSRDMSNSAAADVKKARTLLDKADRAMPEAGLKPVVTYCDGRLKLLDLADKVDAAFLKGDTATANKLSDRYNEQEKALTASARKLPETPADAVNEAYQKETETTATRYYALRDRMSDL